MPPAQQSLPNLSRRQLLATAAAATTLSALSLGRASAGPIDAADVIVVGAGLAGLVATSELVAAGRRVLLLDQEPETGLGGQAFWSLGGLFFIDSLEQRIAGVRDSLELARRDWFNTAGFDRGPDDPLGEDYWGTRWAEAYLQFAAGEKQSWLAGLGMRWVPYVGWAERGDRSPNGPGNSVPRFHLTLGTGPGVMEPFEKLVRDAQSAGRSRSGSAIRSTGSSPPVMPSPASTAACSNPATRPAAHPVPAPRSASSSCTPRW